MNAMDPTAAVIVTVKQRDTVTRACVCVCVSGSCYVCVRPALHTCPWGRALGWLCEVSTCLHARYSYKISSLQLHQMKTYPILCNFSLTT